MKILTIHPGASYSTADVYNGIVKALGRQGHEVFRYNLDGRIESSGAYLHYHRRREMRRGREMPRILPAHVLLHAAQDVLARALWNDVDMVLVISGMYLHPDYMLLMRKAGLQVGVLLTESPYDDERQGPFIETASIVWTNERGSVNYLRQWNANVFYLPHAFDPDLHAPAAQEDTLPAHDALFIGTGFQERVEMLEGADWSGIDLGLYGTWELVGKRHPLRPHIYDCVIPNATAAQMYQKSKINLNIYRTSKGFGKRAPRVTDAESLNPRALELAACGAFTLSDARAEVTEVFGDLVPTFRDGAELEALVRRYLADPDERARIAGALPQAVAGWTFDARAAQMMTDLASIWH